MMFGICSTEITTEAHTVIDIISYFVIKLISFTLSLCEYISCLMSAITKIEMNRDMVRYQVRRSLKLEIIEYRADHPECGSFIMPDLLGTQWGRAYLPFYELYEENNKTARQEMGKLLSDVAKDMGLRSVKENRFGKKDAITRYFF